MEVGQAFTLWASHHAEPHGCNVCFVAGTIALCVVCHAVAQDPEVPCFTQRCANTLCTHTHRGSWVVSSLAIKSSDDNTLPWSAPHVCSEVGQGRR